MSLLTLVVDQWQWFSGSKPGPAGMPASAYWLHYLRWLILKTMFLLICLILSSNEAVLALENAQFIMSGSMGLRNANKRIALWVTEKVGTMWCAYAFCLLALISLPEALASQDPLKIVSWTAQTFLQLVLLPIIIVGQNIQSGIAERQAETDSKTLVAIKQLAEEIHEATYKPSTALLGTND